MQQAALVKHDLYYQQKTTVTLKKGKGLVEEKEMLDRPIVDQKRPGLSFQNVNNTTPLMKLSALLKLHIDFSYHPSDHWTASSPNFILIICMKPVILIMSWYYQEKFALGHSCDLGVKSSQWSDFCLQAGITRNTCFYTWLIKVIAPNVPGKFLLFMLFW